jgi:hypothetical protein
LDVSENKELASRFPGIVTNLKKKIEDYTYDLHFSPPSETLMCIVLHTPLHPQVGGRKHGFRGVENEQQSHSLTDTVYFTFYVS